jgi:hypothetical protein
VGEGLNSWQRPLPAFYIFFDTVNTHTIITGVFAATVSTAAASAETVGLSALKASLTAVADQPPNTGGKSEPSVTV